MDNVSKGLAFVMTMDTHDPKRDYVYARKAWLSDVKNESKSKSARFYRRLWLQSIGQLPPTQFK